MHLSCYLGTVTVLILTRLPIAILRTFPGHVCRDEGTSCVYREECASEWISTSQCQWDKVCCIGGLRHKESEESIEAKVQPSIYLKPEKGSVLLQVLLPKLKYSADSGQKDDIEEDRIVNIQLLNDSIPPPKIIKPVTKLEKEDDNDIVFPASSEEENDDKLKSIKQLFEIYAKDFLKYNTRKMIEEPRRKLKYNIGYRSSKYCTLYETYMANKSLLATPLLPSPFPVLMQKTHCSKPLPLIVGGMDATKGEFPHMAALGYDRGEWIDFLCGGSLISERYVLTAGHCGHTKWGQPIIVRLGTRNLITDDGQNMDVEKVIVHPDYKEPSCYNDIALIKIAAGLKMGSNLRPACLPQMSTRAGEPGSLLTATGWGRTGYGLFSSPNLQKVSLEIMDNNTCDQLFLGGRRTERLPTGIQSSMLCATGYLDSSHDTCQGDSGGPLQAMTQHSKCMYEVVGITSFGKLCGTGLPAIYTRVSTYIPWIEDIVWPS